MEDDKKIKITEDLSKEEKIDQIIKDEKKHIKITENLIEVVGKHYKII